MIRKRLAWLLPPVAVARYGCATCTAGPIGVFWLTSLVSIGYGLSGGTLGGIEGSQWFLVGLGVLMWLISGMWANLVLGAVDHDLNAHPEASRQRRVIPHLDEPDPFIELSKGR